jgi:PTS system mannose-specific IIA component
VIGIVIVAHGGLAREYLAAMEHVVGRSSGTAAIAVGAEDDCGTKQAELDDAVRAVDAGQGVVMVTDMFGSTPWNLAVRSATKGPNRRVLCGANMPMLVKLAKARGLPMNDAVASALTAGRKYINCIDGFGEQRTPIAL